MNKHLIDKAILVISAMVDDEKRLNEVNKMTDDIYGDFSPELQRMTPWIEKTVVGVLDEILGNDGLASYFLYECLNMKEGGVDKIGDVEWPLKTIENLRDYAYHLHGVKHG